MCPARRETRRKASSPASGSGASANQPSITGSSVRWIAARRLTPRGQRLEVAQRAGRVDVAERLQPRLAASGVSRASPGASRATA